jgi:hypothetical protein
MCKFKAIPAFTLFMLVGVGAALAASQDLTKKPYGDRPSPRPKGTVINCIKAPCNQPHDPRPKGPVIYCIKAPCNQPHRPRPVNDRPSPRPRDMDSNCRGRGCSK